MTNKTRNVAVKFFYSQNLSISMALGPIFKPIFYTIKLCEVYSPISIPLINSRMANNNNFEIGSIALADGEPY